MSLTRAELVVLGMAVTIRPTRLNACAVESLKRRGLLDAVPGPLGSPQQYQASTPGKHLVRSIVADSAPHA